MFTVAKLFLVPVGVNLKIMFKAVQTYDDRAGASGSVRGKQIARAVKGQAPRKRQPGGEDTGGPSRGNFYNPVAEKVRVVEVPQGSETVNWNRGRCQTGNDREGDEGELRFSCGAHSGELFLEV